jgi:hypothetical protein
MVTFLRCCVQCVANVTKRNRLLVEEMRSLGVFQPCLAAFCESLARTFLYRNSSAYWFPVHNMILFHFQKCWRDGQNVVFV